MGRQTAFPSSALLDWKSIGNSNSLTRFPRNGRVSQIGDSNTDDAFGRPGWQTAINYEWFARGGILEGWVNYNLGANGSQVKGWVDSIATGNSSTATTVRGSAWAAVNMNPDLIIISLGTNDLNSAANRATVGVPATLLANFKTLVDFCLSHSRAAIWLRMPSPIGLETFLGGIPGFTDATDCDNANATLRSIYEIYDQGGAYSHPRITLFHSHRALFGNTLHAIATDCLDPVTGFAMMSDSLHPTNLGYRRKAELMARQFSGTNLPLPRLITTPEQVFRDAVWSQTAFVSGRSSNTMNMDINPQNFAADTTIVDANSANLAFAADDTRRGPISQNRMADMLRRACSQAAGRQILAAGGGSGQPGSYSGSVWMYWHGTGNIYQIDYLTPNQIVASTPDYFQVTAVNPSPSFAGGDVTGFVTFYVTDPRFVPYQNWRATPDISLSIPNGQTYGSAVGQGSYNTTALLRVLAIRGGPEYSGTTVELREFNQVDGRYVSEATYNGGKVIASASFSPGQLVGVVTLDPSGHYGTTTNIRLASAQPWLRAVVTSGSVVGDLTLNMCWR